MKKEGEEKRFEAFVASGGPQLKLEIIFFIMIGQFSI